MHVGAVAVHRTIHVRYPDGPQDCEAIAVDTAQRRVIMVAKGRLPWAGVYAVSLGMDASETREPEEARNATAATQTAQRIGTIPVPMTTALDISADGRQMAVASYLDLFLFEREEDETWEEALRRTPRHVPMPPLKQIEAICYDQQGALWVTSEGDPMPLVRVDVSAGRAE